MSFRISFNTDILGWRFPCPFKHSVGESSQPNSDSVRFQLMEPGHFTWQYAVSRYLLHGG